MVKLLIDWVLTLTIIVVGTTQVIWPLWRNRPLFPLVRPRAELEAAQAEAQEEVDEEAVIAEIERLHAKADAMAKKRRSVHGGSHGA